MTSTSQSQLEDADDDSVFEHHTRIVEAGQYAAEALLHFRDCLGSAFREVPVGAEPAEWIVWAKALETSALLKQLESTFLQPIVGDGDSLVAENDDFGLEGSGQGSTVEDEEEEEEEEEDDDEEEGSDSSGTYRVDSDGDEDLRTNENQPGVEGEVSKFLESGVQYCDPRVPEIRRSIQVETRSEGTTQQDRRPPAFGGVGGIGRPATVPALPAVAAEASGRASEAPPWPDVELDQSFDVSDFEKLSGAEEDCDGDELEYTLEQTDDQFEKHSRRRDDGGRKQPLDHGGNHSVAI